MKRICNFILLLCLVQLAVAQNRIAEIRENLLGNHPDKILVVSHRADWRNAPENSLQDPAFARIFSCSLARAKSFFNFSTTI